MAIKNINKRGEFLARNLYIALVLFGIITGVGYLIIDDIASEESGYNVENMTDENFRDDYDTITESTDDIHLMQNATSSGKGMSVISTYTTVFSATFSVISIIFGSFSMIDSVFTSFTKDFLGSTAIANLVFDGILIIITGLIVFIIISSISKGKM